MGIPVLLVESDAVIKTLLYIFVLCYIFVITFWNILSVHLVSCDLFFTVNFQWWIQIIHKGRGGGGRGIENGSELNKTFLPSPPLILFA